MRRIAIAAVSCATGLLVTGLAVRAETSCNGVVAIEVVETDLGMMPVRQLCDEYGPSSPYLFDAAPARPRAEPSVTQYDSSQLEALSAYSIGDLIDLNPIPRELRPKDEQ